MNNNLGLLIKPKVYTISVKKEILDEFRLYKVHPRESDNECLSRLLLQLKNSGQTLTNGEAH